MRADKNSNTCFLCCKVKRNIKRVKKKITPGKGKGEREAKKKKEKKEKGVKDKTSQIS